jgi:hypothetical protein
VIRQPFEFRGDLSPNASAAFERGVAVRIAFAFAVALMLACGAAARGEPDAFVSVVGFALTGSDDAEPKVIGNRADCIFASTTTSSV